NRTTAGLRDRKKAETRANIARAAVELFVYHGPEHTTIANIAEQAAISTRTFHNYFPNLEAALLHHLEEMVVNLART
ncbi:TetR family transcriptional regulator, partial [Klebsiella pneumoniae]